MRRCSLSLPCAARTALVALCVAIVASPLAAQTVPDTVTRRPERITGRVTTDSGAAIAGAEVIVTRGPDRAFQRDTTGRDGRYAIDWKEGTGDYLVYVAAPGRRAFRTRVQRSGAADTLFTVDAALAPAVTQLAAVKVRASRPKPARGGEDPYSPLPGNVPGVPEGLAGALAPDLQGDLAALATTVPGMLATGSGFSALGLDPSQNTVTLDGLAFGGSDLPREARTSTAVSTNQYDPTRGGFSGASQNVELIAGGVFSRRTGSLSLDAPQLQAADAVARRTGQQFTNLSASGGMNGPLGWKDQYFYSVAGQLSRRRSDAASLFSSASPAVLAAAGVSGDSLALLARTLDRLGIPRSAPFGDASLSERGSLLARFDWAPFDWSARTPRKNAGALTLYAAGRRAEPLALSPLVAATRGARSEGATLGIQGLVTLFFGKKEDQLTELRTGLTFTRDRVDPALAFPAASVLVSGSPAANPDSIAISSLGIGGGASAARSNRGFAWETRSETQWYPALRHRLKLGVETRLDSYTNDQPGNRWGSFGYLSLADLEANHPASFARTLASGAQQGGLWSGALSLGDFWSRGDRLQLVYGARLEGNRYTTRPAYNPDVERVFGVRTDYAPDRVRLSPRLGFTWRLTKKQERGGFSFSSLGQFPISPDGYLRGGLGEFRNLPSATLLADPIAATGLPGGTQQLLCLGDAVPVPQWDQFGSGLGAVPTHCAAGAPNLADTTRRVTLVAPGFDAPHSWRANLALTKRTRIGFFTVNGVLSLNRNQPGRTELNLHPAPLTMLASEGGRPLYAPIAAIVPASGSFSPAAAREDPTMGRVTALVSDLRSTSSQLVVSVVPKSDSRSRLALTYILGSMRAEQRGFDGAAFGDLWRREVARGGLDVRHQFQVAAGHTFTKVRATTVTLFAQFRSGLPYTPLVSGDVNGDGSANDRAFIHDPATAASAGDAALAAGMRALLAETPGRARDCLERQLGRAAGRNSCEGPWTATMNARIDVGNGFIPFGPHGVQRRMHLSLNLANPLGGVDQLLHGSRGMRGWGGSALPDPVLYAVTGFDPATQRFRYRTNSRFGSSSPTRSTLRTPFRVTLDVQVNLSRPTEEQQVDRFLTPGRTRRGTKLDSAALHLRYKRNVPDVYTYTLNDADTLLLTRAQTEALQASQAQYRATLDTLWAQLAGEFARLPDRFDAAAALARQEGYIQRAWDLNRMAALRVKEILTPAQMQVVSWLVKSLVNSKETVTMRFSMY